MKKALKNISSSHQASARVVDGKLILSLPNALTPVVWQMDFSDVKASALEVNEEKGDGTYVLTMKTPKGTATKIAPFEKREQAVGGLMAAANALENAQGQIRTVSSSGKEHRSEATTVLAAPQEQKSGSKWGIVLGILFLIVLFFIWSAMTMPPPGSMDMDGAGSQITTRSAPQQNESGVPLSADEFLRSR